MNSPSLCVKDVRNILNDLKNFQKDYTEKFRNRTQNLKDQALQYLKGKFLERGRGNMTVTRKLFLKLTTRDFRILFQIHRGTKNLLSNKSNWM